MKYKRKCPKCGRELYHATELILQQSIKGNRACYKCVRTGVKRSESVCLQLSLAHKSRYCNVEEKAKTSEQVKLAMHRPDVRKKHIEALHHSKWIKVRTDKGQLELIEKWNRLGFKFEPNYQIHTDTDLFYVDGYDKEHNVVLEYDSKYHNKPYQQQKDLVRQQKIISILNPKKFWRYRSINKHWENVIGE